MYVISIILFTVIESFEHFNNQILTTNTTKTESTDHLILVGGSLEHVSGPLDVQQDVGEDTNGVLIASHHQIRETHIIIGGDLTLRHT